MEFGVEYSASGKSRLGLNELKCAMPHSEKEEDIKFVFSFPLVFFFFFSFCGDVIRHQHFMRREEDKGSGEKLENRKRRDGESHLHLLFSIFLNPDHYRSSRESGAGMKERKGGEKLRKKMG